MRKAKLKSMALSSDSWRNHIAAQGPRVYARERVGIAHIRCYRCASTSGPKHTTMQTAATKRKRRKVVSSRGVQRDGHLSLARDMAKKKSPFAGCYLCKLEPGSQHLHVLGNAVPPELMQELELAGTSASSDIVLPEFYCGRALFVRNALSVLFI